jgi:NAD-dependent dihydropyrimidine dehydrogenase PreA subunit
MTRMRAAMLAFACASLLGCSGGGSGDHDSDASTSMPPAKVCTFGADQTCNDNPLISSLHGTCQADGTCVCQLGFAKTVSGRCR